MKGRNRTNRKGGFTLVEALVSIGLLGIGIAASLGALTQMGSTEQRVEKSEQIQVLAHRKLQEIIATGEYQQAPLDGNFELEGLPDVTWSATMEPSGVESLETVSLTVSEGSEDSQYTAMQVVFRAPTETGGAQQP